jgi:stearoyl-CoA desaturase (delta-9 desaturase)
MLKKLIKWFDNDAVTQQMHSAPSTSLQLEHASAASHVKWGDIDLWRVAPFVLLHLACLCVIWVGFSWFALVFAIAMYLLRMFAVTGFYHRYFSHKAFRTTRAFQLLLAIIGATAVQRGPLWWASHHRHHHTNSDEHDDAHSPVQHGFIWSHLGWFLSNRHFTTQTERVKDLAKFVELRWLDRFDIVVPSLFALSIYLLGAWLQAYYPALNTSGAQLLVWGFVISTVVLYHATFTVNSLAHVWGRRRYATRDHSRNNLWIAIITLGEGWHNNHHHYPGSAQQGFYWWEIDLTYYGLKLLAACGLIWDVRTVPEAIRDSRKIVHQP